MTIKCIPELARALDSAEQVEGVIKSWKMSTDDAKQLRWTWAAMRDENGNAKSDMAQGIPKRWIVELFTLYFGYNSNATRHVIDWEVPVFPVSGQDLIDAGMKPGPLMGKALQLMRADWVASDYTETKEDLLDYVDMYRSYSK